MSLEPDAAAGLRVVFVRGLELRASLGVHPHEKAAPQRVVIDVELAVRDEAAPSGVGEDDLRRTVDYARGRAGGERHRGGGAHPFGGDAC